MWSHPKVLLFSKEFIFCKAKDRYSWLLELIINGFYGSIISKNCLGMMHSGDALTVYEIIPDFLYPVLYASLCHLHMFSIWIGLKFFSVLNRR